MACKDKTTGTWVAQWYEVDMYGKKIEDYKNYFKEWYIKENELAPLMGNEINESEDIDECEGEIV